MLEIKLILTMKKYVSDEFHVDTVCVMWVDTDFMMNTSGQPLLDFILQQGKINHKKNTDVGSK